MGEQKPSHIAKVAESLAGKLKVRVEDALSTFHSETRVCPQTLYEHRGTEVRKELSRMSPETLGRIAVQGKARGDEDQPSEGKTTLYDVHCGSYLGKYESGRNILLELALTAVIAEMTDQLERRRLCDVLREADEADRAMGYHDPDSLEGIPDRVMHNAFKRTE